MRKRAIPLIVALLGLALRAFAGPVVTVGNYSVSAGNKAVVQVSVTDADSPAADDIEGMTFTLQIAAGTGTNPSIASIDLLTGSVWAPDANSSDVYSAAGSEPQYQSLGILTNSPGLYINANGLLATVTINTSGATLGNYSLKLTGTMSPGGDSAFTNGIDATVPATFTAGQLTLTTPNLLWNGAAGDGTTWNTTQQNFTDGTYPTAYIAGDLVTFTDANNNHFNVAIPSAISPPSVTVNAAGNYTFTGTGGIAGNGSLTKLGTGTLTISSPLSYTGATTISAGKLSLATNLTTTSGISVASGATLQLQNAATINLSNLTLPTGSTLDITTNVETFNTNISGHSAATLTSLLKSAYDNGAWDLSGIGSSSVKNKLGTSVGYNISGANFKIMYTWIGDANLDGQVNSTDLSAIVSTGTNWATGDFNYDGKVNMDDYSLFMLGVAAGKGSNISTTLPEPTLVLSLAGLIAMRRRHRAK